MDKVAGSTPAVGFGGKLSMACRLSAFHRRPFWASTEGSPSGYGIRLESGQG